MITVLAITSLFLHADAVPISLGPITPPTIAHDLLFGRQVHCDCTGVMQRTLFDIVRSCLLTIAACVYRAIHQNIPDPKATWGQRMSVRIKITIMALFAPEMMIWWAMKQWMAARMIRNEVNLRHPELEWTLTHGYFLQMGGFVRQDNGRILILRNLLEHLEDSEIDLNALRKISKKEIDDHSKGDLLSKALVTLQTTWFVLECITRWQQKLLLTELEVVTLAFAVLNMFTYTFWWYKPLDVLCPLKLDIHDTPLVGGQAQQQVVSSQIVGSTGPASHPPATVQDDMPKVNPIRRRITIVLSSLSSIGQHVRNVFDTWGSSISEGFQTGGWLRAISTGVAVPFFGLLRWLQGLFEQTKIRYDATHVPTFYTGEIDEDKWSWVFSLCCFIGVIFGGIHFLSWKSHFPSHTESLLWKTSSIILVTEPILIAIFQYIMSSGRVFPEFVMSFLAFTSSIIGPVAYILARSCLLILAFLSLHNLPPPAFETVSWTAYIPHL